MTTWGLTSPYHLLPLGSPAPGWPGWTSRPRTKGPSRSSPGRPGRIWSLSRTWSNRPPCRQRWNPVVHRLPRPVPFREVSPGGSSPEQPENGVQDGPMVLPLATALSVVGREQIPDQLPLLVRKFVPSHPCCLPGSGRLPVSLLSWLSAVWAFVRHNLAVSARVVRTSRQGLTWLSYRKVTGGTIPGLFFHSWQQITRGA
jgi:hypothetical protein